MSKLFLNLNDIEKIYINNEKGEAIVYFINGKELIIPKGIYESNCALYKKNPNGNEEKIIRNAK
ncbi:MAG: hypothetical protein ACRC6K_00100 [Fusobacteriaceae bacterium]